MNYLIVSIGAAMGSALRYWVSNVTYKYLPSYFPYGTLLVNIIGSFILGLIMFNLDQRELINAQLKIFLTIGLCGGFTTFSYETINLFKDSQVFLGFVNIFASIFFSFLGILLAYFISKI